MPPLILVPPYKKNLISSLVASWSVPPNYGGVGKKYAGWIGNAASLSEGAKFTINVPKTANGVRFILQAAGGGSSKNDADGDSSANSGATCDFILPPTVTGDVEVLIGSAGIIGGQSIGYPVSPRPISLASDPLGDPPSATGQSGFTGSGAYNSAMRFIASNTLLAYAEGGGGSISFDYPYATASRAWIATASGLGITGSTFNGPLSTGRGTHAGDGNWPNWNFNIYQNFRTAYGLADPASEIPYIASAQYGKGGREALISGSGEAGKPGFLWMIIL